MCRVVLSIYERERAHWGSHSATANRLGIHRTTLYDWLERARRHVANQRRRQNDNTL
jgi:transposase-like protein